MIAQAENIKSQAYPTFIPLRHISQAEVNKEVYRPINKDDPAVRSLAKDIEVNGVLEPLVISSDRRIISGHRRYIASIMAGLDAVPCRVMDIDSDDPGFLNLLVSFNTQRVKNANEIVREAAVKVNPEEAYDALLDERVKGLYEDIIDQCEDVAEGKNRKKIGPLKMPMVKAIIKIVNDNKKFWPMSVRGVHYRLLNDPPLLNANNKELYSNSKKCYEGLTDMTARMRLERYIPMNCIDDKTRASVEWGTDNNVQDFITAQLEGFLKGYWRNCQQTQKRHIEVVCEKDALQSVIRPVCAKYGIPYSIGRGFPSIPSRTKIANRFKKSGKDWLLLLHLGDHDPDGVQIGVSLTQSLRREFGLLSCDVDYIRVGVTPEQVERLGITTPPLKAKKTSKNYKKFFEKYGNDAYELEVLENEDIQQILTEAIDGVLDIDAFNEELRKEKEDSAHLEVVRSIVKQSIIDGMMEAGL